MSTGWALALLLVLLGSGPARANAVALELSASRNLRAWSVLGDVTLREDGTFLTLGYTGTRSEPGTAASHLLTVGVDHALSSHWLVSGLVSLGLPKTSLQTLAPERPLLDLPGLTARTGYGSVGLALSAGYDSGGFSDVEFGADAGLVLTRYQLRRQLVAREDGERDNLFTREEPLGLARPSLGGRLMLGDHWELGLRAGVWLYSGDPLTAGQFTAQETEEVLRRYASENEARAALRAFLAKQLKDLGAVLQDINAVTGFPSAPGLFDVKPSVSYRFNATVRGQVAYSFTRYVADEGVAHVLSTRWTVRVSEPVRLWGSLALQSDVFPEGGTLRTNLFTLGGEYSF
ncbi:hypothetical protein P2318_12790 [Myxococcaceae bacterium GXIMD 01537]